MRAPILTVVGGEQHDGVGSHLGRLPASSSTRPIWRSTARAAAGRDRSSRPPGWPCLGPPNGTAPNDRAAVSCSERCKGGLPLAATARGSRSSAAARRSADGADALGAKRSLQRYHQAMSCGLTNDTVVHHGCRPELRRTSSGTGRRSSGPLRQPCPGAPFGRWVGPTARSHRAQASRCWVPVVVAMGEMPLAIPVGLVAVFAQHRPPGRKARIQRAAAVIMQPVWCV